jgi:hypothetical protein
VCLYLFQIFGSLIIRRWAFFTALQRHSLEHLDHLYYLPVTILFLLVHLALSQQFVPKQVDYDLFVDVGAPPQEVLLWRRWIGAGLPSRTTALSHPRIG